MHNEKEKLKSKLLKRWCIILAISASIIFLGIILRMFVASWFTIYLHRQLIIEPGSQTFLLWSKPPVVPRFNFYIYNVTNPNEFLENHETPIVTELGPYVYTEHWEKVNIRQHDNGTITFNQVKILKFNKESSGGSDMEMVIVPNMALLSASALANSVAPIERGFITTFVPDNTRAFIKVTVKQLLWGYPDEIMATLADVDPSIPYKGEFGIRYNKNGTSADNVTMYTGSGDMSKFALIDNVNGMTHLPYHYGDECNTLMGSDGSLFPPSLTKNTTLKLYDKDLCRLLHLKFREDIVAPGNVHGYRFSPADNVFGTPDENPENACFYEPGVTPHVPSGFADASKCQFNAPVYLSFPHFYLADDSHRSKFEGITPPDLEKHSTYLDVNPTLGVILSTRIRLQLNVAVINASTFPHLENFPDIIFPILWFEECLDGLPEDVNNMINLAEGVVPNAKIIITLVFIIGGVILLIISIWRIFKAFRSKPTAIPMSAVK